MKVMKQQMRRDAWAPSPEGAHQSVDPVYIQSEREGDDW